MKVFALSDLHVDYPTNAEWVGRLSVTEYRDDILILAGDVSDSQDRLQRCLEELCARFRAVLFVPGNHELWVARDRGTLSSWDKFHAVCELANRCGAHTRPYRREGISIVPLFSWYDYSFGLPGDRLTEAWMDFYACRWPGDWTMADVASRFYELNEPWIAASEDFVISFSHFLPRIDIMPRHIPESQRYLYPVLGSHLIERQVRRLGARLHVYGHSHVNLQTVRDGTRYINNAFGNPRETRTTAKALLCIHDTSR